MLSALSSRSPPRCGRCGWCRPERCCAGTPARCPALDLPQLGRKARAALGFDLEATEAVLVEAVDLAAAAVKGEDIRDGGTEIVRIQS